MTTWILIVLITVLNWTGGVHVESIKIPMKTLSLCERAATKFKMEYTTGITRTATRSLVHTFCIKKK